MTAYRGTVTIRMSGVLDDYSLTFTAIGQITIDLFNASLAGDGTLSGMFAGSGSVSFSSDFAAATDIVTYADTPFSTPISNLSLPFDMTVLGLPIAWSDIYSVSPSRAGIGIAREGTFSGVVDGVAASGTITASGGLAAVTSAYGIQAFGTIQPEGTETSGTTDFSFIIYRVGPIDGFGTVSWQVAGSGANPANAADFAGATLPGGTVTFQPYEASQLITVPVVGDDFQEGDEGFVVTVPEEPGEVMSVTTSAQGTIMNDDFALISIEALLADVAEGAAGETTPFTFVISRRGNTAESASVAWAVEGSGDTPANAADFMGGVLPSGTVSFLPGETSRTITVPVAGDVVPEAQESFMVALSTPTGGPGLGTSMAPGLIINDDGGSGQVAASRFGADTFNMGDGSDLVRFAAERSRYRIGMQDNRIHVEGPDGPDELTDVEWLKFGTAPAISREALYDQPETEHLLMRILTSSGGSSQVVSAIPTRYAGPLDLAYVYACANSDNTLAGTPLNDFVNLAGGNDAADMGAGNDIIDGGGGSNFLTGGAGSDQFFIDGRYADPVWSCITDWEMGESLAIWGWRAGVSVGSWGENAGLPGFLGATFFADIDGSGAVETVVTFTGRSVAEMPAAGILDVGGIGVLKFG